MWTIYKLTCTKTGMPYVGLTRNTVGIRWRQHQSDARRKSLPNHPLYVALRAEGAAAFKVEVIGHAETREEAFLLETKLIAEHDSLWPRGYNRNTGGVSNKPDHEVRERQRLAALKRGPMSAAAIAKAIATKRGRPPSLGSLAALRRGSETRWQHLAHLTPEERRERHLKRKRDWMRDYLARKAIAAGRIPGRPGHPVYAQLGQLSFPF